ncbi:basigin-like [Tigriopus californicus]|uniref:basigin-like n=1 Tax=Tigriopus californicus TaxID=6832 RepID=UPI0027DA15A5|nr:basigin-like [Tigriopus californicus]
MRGLSTDWGWVAGLALLCLIPLALGDDEGSSLEDISTVLDNEEAITGLRMWPPNGKRMASENGDYTVRCQYNDSEAQIKWYEVPDEGSERELTEDEVEIEINPESKSSTLTVPQAMVKRGLYRCKVGEQVGEFTYESFFKLVPFTLSNTVIEKDDLKLFCRLRPGSLSDGSPRFSWFKKPEGQPESEGVPIKTNSSDTIDGEPHIKIIQVEDDQSMLKIEDARYSDRAIYGCKVENSYGQMVTAQALVRVKDKLAALYPFIGIVAEVIALCLVIFMCERRKTNDCDDEDDGNEEEEFNGGTPAHGNNSNVRRRN